MADLAGSTLVDKHEKKEADKEEEKEEEKEQGKDEKEGKEKLQKDEERQARSKSRSSSRDRKRKKINKERASRSRSRSRSTDDPNPSLKLTLKLKLSENMKISKGYKAFGDEVMSAWCEGFANCYSKDEYDFVSVGSGNGCLELMIQEAMNREVICIDPNPSCFLGDPIYLTPKFSTIEDYDKERTRGCILLLNWCCPNDSSYDHEAVQLLKPVAVLAIAERPEGGIGGGAGGDQWWEWAHNAIDGQDDSQYNAPFSAFCCNPLLGIWYRLHWFQHKEAKEIPALEEKFTGCQICCLTRLEESCAIM